MKTVSESCVLLPSEAGLPSVVDTGEKLLEEARTKQVDLAEEIYLYALDLGFPVPDTDCSKQVQEEREKRGTVHPFQVRHRAPSQGRGTVPANRHSDQRSRELCKGFEEVGEG